MCAYRKVKRASAVHPQAQVQTRRKPKRVTKSKQAGNMRLIGSIIAFGLVILGMIIVGLLFLLDGFLISAHQSTGIITAYAVVIGIVYLFLALFWRTLFHAGGEHLDKMDMLTNQNNRMIERLTEITEQNNTLIEMLADKIEFDYQQGKPSN